MFSTSIPPPIIIIIITIRLSISPSLTLAHEKEYSNNSQTETTVASVNKKKRGKIKDRRPFRSRAFNIGLSAFNGNISTVQLFGSWFWSTSDVTTEGLLLLLMLSYSWPRRPLTGLTLSICISMESQAFIFPLCFGRALSSYRLNLSKTVDHYYADRNIDFLLILCNIHTYIYIHRNDLFDCVICLSAWRADSFFFNVLYNIMCKLLLVKPLSRQFHLIDIISLFV